MMSYIFMNKTERHATWTLNAWKNTCSVRKDENIDFSLPLKLKGELKAFGNFLHESFPNDRSTCKQLKCFKSKNSMS
jgi:hypothetical protein